MTLRLKPKTESILEEMQNNLRISTKTKAIHLAIDGYHKATSKHFALKKENRELQARVFQLETAISALVEAVKTPCYMAPI